MAYLAKIFARTQIENREIIAAFHKKAILNPTLIKPGSRSNYVGRPLAPIEPTRDVCKLHISSLITFVNAIKYQFFIEKNYVHENAKEEVFHHTKCLGFGQRDDGERVKPSVKVFIFTIVCKGTSLCRASESHGPSSRRRFCGYGTRFFVFNAAPDIVHVEEFGRHIDELGERDLGYRLVPPLQECRKYSFSMEIDCLKSFCRGLTPAKHVAFLGEVNFLESTSNFFSDTNDHQMGDNDGSTVVLDVRNAYRRFNRIVHAVKDEDGIRNIILHFRSKQDVFYIDVQNIDDYNQSKPFIFLLCVREICEEVDQFGRGIIGLDATFNVTMYGMALFALMGRTNGGAIPLAYFISSSKSELAVTMGLQKFRKAIDSILFDKSVRIYGAEYSIANFKSYHPMGICIDKDDAELNAIRTVFPESLPVLCHYHFMVIMIDEVRASRHSLEESEVKAMMGIVREIASTTTINDLFSKLEEMKELSSSYHSYFETNFLNNRWIDTFSEVNRQHFPLSLQRLCRSNMLVEVSFRTLKYTIFGGLQNKRLDELLYSIAFRLYPYFMIRQAGVRKCAPRLITNTSDRKSGTLLYK